MFTEALRTTAKIRKQLKCPSTGEWVKKRCVCIYTHTYNEILLSHKKKNEILPFATWMDFKSIMLSEISHTEKDKYCNGTTYMQNHKTTTNEYNKKEADSQIEQISHYLWERTIQG